MFAGSGLSLADIAAVTNKNNDGGFGDGNGWWILIILFALFGWGNNGYGNNGSNGGSNGGDNVTVVPVPMYGGGYGFGGGWGAFDAASMQRGFDNSTMIGKVDRLGDGIAQLGYDQLAQMNTLGRAIDQVNYNTERAANANAVATMQQFNALSTQLANCCCDNRADIAALKSAMEASDCSIKTLMNQLFQQLQWQDMQNAQALTQLINQKFCDLSMAQKDETIAALRTQLSQCGDQNMANWIVNQLKGVINPTPQPAFLVPNPNGCCNPCNN